MLTFTFPWPDFISDYMYIVETSENVITWDPATLALLQRFEPGEDGISNITARISGDPSSLRNLLVRLLIEEI